jgi:hypothetical protein
MDSTVKVLINAFRAVPHWRETHQPLVTRISQRFDPLFRSTGPTAHVSTLYKRKAQKVLPQNTQRLDHAAPRGNLFWKENHVLQEREMFKRRRPEKWDK